MATKSMTEGAPWKHILRFAFPVLLGSLLQQLYNTVDTIIVGNFANEEALSAVGTTSSLVFLFMAVAIGFSSGNGVVISQCYGAKDEKGVRANASTGLILLLGLGIIVSILALISSRIIFTDFVAVPKDILGLTLQYFRIYALGIFFQFGYNIFSSILRAVGDSAATLYFLLISSVVNIILDLIFVAGFKWSVVGAAVATDIAQIVSFICAYFYMIKRYPIFYFKLKELTFEKSLALKTIVIGFPIALQLMIVSLGLTFIQRAVNGFGKTMVASFTVGQRIEMYINLPCTAFQTTLATYTGQNIGAGKIERVKKGIKQTVLMSLILTICIGILIWIFAGNICHAFGISKAAEAYCFRHLRAIALVNIILSAYVPLFGVFQGSNHPAIPMLVATFALTTRVSVVYLLRYSAFLGSSIIWWNGLFGFGIGFIVAWSYYLSGRWSKKSSILTY